ncbi:PTS glucitol transporter subunit IIA [Virgibacillus pantothenticus]|uniref:PTS galactitol transporter subunit IIC n=1 Tax=Virgibacillus pantothenticus TaxID=1473 RepID=UPI001B04F594|nr:PTS transporter subunit IIC [Virgibacillus pantothenticus]MBU8568233.1 PTS glucitol transporter subunit IIA [Virgibacillus pantothenticus]MBU8601841.1 PTS glucitol transporter subunit IIA [Virgibacillus pantothenticus]MBU8636066.1 PTS glucitol transporter subunit IIA [Virgibacillus pantothenticus]MBU8644145.1 PTS glucitol transporter subunit IIA [Virgibacillus pantothenticus]MBU8647903.1 PTS glucitol transporter subunit IIA [Virgibacillus pantothenticus]
MDAIIKFANSIFQPIIDLGAAPMMFILLTLLAVLMRVKVSKALEGGLKLAIALTGIGAVIDLLTGNFAPALQDFVKSTGIELTITDVGWAPLATITWGSAYTLFFLMILIIVNLALLAMNKTNTLDVDIFNFWHLSITGLLVMFYSDNLFIATMLVIMLGVMKFINADLMKPTFNDLLDMPDSNPTTTTHLNFLLNPLIMLFDKFFEKVLPFLDKYDFDAAWLNEKIGFWGSKFAIGIYLGTFVGLLGQQPVTTIFALAFIGGTALELFSIVGTWFIAAMEPISQGITDFMSKRLKGRTFNIGIDWPFLAARPEMWAAANVIAPIMLFIALILPGNGILPLGGIIAIGLTPALLVVCRGKIIRMILIGTIMIPIFLWSGTAIAPFVTDVATSVGAMPSGIEGGALITHSTLEGPVEKFIAILVGKASDGFKLVPVLTALGALVAYLGLFVWYVKQMKKRNKVYEEEKKAA